MTTGGAAVDKSMRRKPAMPKLTPTRPLLPSARVGAASPMHEAVINKAADVTLANYLSYAPISPKRIWMWHTAVNTWERPSKSALIH
jgi:hypothetical protein